MTTFSVLSWNVNYDLRAESNPKWANFTWAARKASVIDTILAADASIVCLQELRAQSMHDIISDDRIYAKYGFTYGQTNNTDMSFYLLTMWKKTEWLHNSSLIMWMNYGNDCTHWCREPNGNGFGCIALNTILEPAVFPPETPGPNYSGFEILNVYMGLPEKEREAESRFVAAWSCMNLYNIDSIICGDFNSFPDAKGEEFTKIIEGSGVNNTVPYGRVIPMYNEPIYGAVIGTQIPYPYDTFIKYKGTDHEKKCPEEGDFGNRLDHIFISKSLKNVVTHLYSRMTNGKFATVGDMCYHSEDTAPRFPSDHIPILATLMKKEVQ